MTCRTPGLYHVILQVQFTNVATGSRATMLRKNAGGNPANGTLVATAQEPASSTLGMIFTISDDVQLAVGDTLEAFAYQNSGGALNPGINGGSGATFLTARWVAIS
jgi:hypothetical protein